MGFSNLNVGYQLPVIKLGMHQLDKPNLPFVKLVLDQCDDYYILVIVLVAILAQ